MPWGAHLRRRELGHVLVSTCLWLEAVAPGRHTAEQAPEGLERPLANRCRSRQLKVCQSALKCHRRAGRALTASADVALGEGKSTRALREQALARRRRMCGILLLFVKMPTS